MSNPTDSPPKSKMLPPVYLAMAILLMLTLHQWLPGMRLMSPISHWMGATVVVASLCLNFGCAYQFRRRQTTIIPFGESTTLLTTGPYRYSRNPIYLSLFVLLAGVAIALGTLTPWLVLPWFVWVIATRFVPREEEMLTVAFGEAFNEYRQRVRRWF